MKKRTPANGFLSKKRKSKAQKRRKVLGLSPRDRLRRRIRKTDFNWASIAKKQRIFSFGRSQIKFPNKIDLFFDTKGFCNLFHRIAFSETADLEFHFAKLDFIYPEAVVYLAAIAEHLLLKSNTKIKEFQSKNLEAEAYLNISGLKKFFNVKTSQSFEQDPAFNKNCIPISRDPQEKASVAQKMVDLLNAKLMLDMETKTLLSESLGEIMGNAVEHGEVRNWYRIAQLHEKRSAITIAIADNGVGVCHSLRSGFGGENYKKITDAQVLKKSFDSNVTRHPPRVGEAHGYGLTKIIEFIRKTNSKLAILSGSGVYKVDYTSGSMVESFFDQDKPLPGTLIVARISFKDIDEKI
jgi:hypothetical protein